MKYRYSIPLIIAAFIAGTVLARMSLNSEVETVAEALKGWQTELTKLATRLDQIRAMDNLESANEAIEYVFFLQRDDAPREYVGERLSNMLKKRISVLEAVKTELKDTNEVEKAERLLKESRKILEDIEFYYL